MPDAKWNGVYWDFKAPTTLNAIDSRIRKAQNQLQEALDRDNKSNALRGMVVDISDRTISREDAITEIEIRTRSRLKGSTDVIIREGNRLLKVLRFRK